MSERKIFSGGEFLVSEVLAEDVFTPEDFTREQKMVFEAARDFVSKELTPNAELIEEKNEAQVRKWFRMAGEIGLNAIDVPEAYGGEGMDKISACLVTEAMGGGHSFCASHTCQTGIGSLPILLFGNEEQKKKYLPRLATGEHIGAYCLTESGAGSDALNAAATATLSEDGRHYILNGEKIFITNGAWADVLTVFAKVDGQHFTGFIVEKDFPGFSTGAEEKKLGIKGSSTVPVLLKDCRVPVENLLFEVGKGHKIALNVLNIGRYKLGPATTGGAKLALAGSVQYALDRKQFGQAIAGFGMIRDKLAQMAVGIYIAESMCYRLAAAIQDKLSTLDKEKQSSGEEVSKAVEEYSIECALAKVAGSENLDFAVDEMVQIFGGNGYIAEYPAERAYRDSRINRIFEGTNEINRMVAAGTVFRRALTGRLPLFDAVKEAQERVRTFDKARAAAGNGFLGAQKQVLAACKDLFLLATGAAGTRFMDKLIEEQEVLALLSDMMIRVYLMESGLLRALKLAAGKGEKKAELHGAAARVYVAQSLPLVADMARQVLAYAVEGPELETALAGVDALACAFPQENTVALKRQIADRVVKSKKYPL